MTELKKVGQSMENDVILNKLTIIERCIIRINEEYEDNSANLENYTKQDSIILNIQRACEAAIDLAMHVSAELKLGLPQKSREAFDLLNEYGVIDELVTSSLKAMVGFRNIAVHDYQKLNLDVLEKVIENHLVDLKKFKQQILKY
ncbi:hypothetical protein TMU01_20450 [Tenuibacillus multivorans]|nr:hypothetical protein TMU01_20450 [Tenuibacillus multivorans]